MSKLPYGQHVAAVEAMLLPDDAAVTWLKDNAYSEPPTLRQEGRRFKDLVSFAYARRKSQRLTLAVARYGTDRGTLRRLLRSGAHSERLAVLGNVLIGPQTFFESDRFVLSKQEANAIVANRSTSPAEFVALLSNPYVEREWLTDVVGGEGVPLDDATLQDVVDVLVENPMIAAEHDDTFMDGFAEHSYNRLNFALLDLLQTVPVNKKWTHLFERLLGKLHIPFVPDFKVSLLDRWQNPEPDPTGQRYDPFQHLRTAIVRTLVLENHRQDVRESVSLDHADKAVRLGMYSALKPFQLFGGFVDAERFAYPDFKNLESSELTKEQQIVVNTCKACFERDGNDFVEHLIWNEHFWRTRAHREFTNRLGWDLAADPSSHMDLPNLYRAREQHYLQARPDWFVDDEFAETPESQTVEGRVKKIDRDVAVLTTKLNELSENRIDERPLLAALATQLQSVVSAMHRQVLLLIVLLGIAIYIALH